jgi:hypothetical protein
LDEGDALEVSIICGSVAIEVATGTFWVGSRLSTCEVWLNAASPDVFCSLVLTVGVLVVFCLTGITVGDGPGLLD